MKCLLSLALVLGFLSSAKAASPYFLTCKSAELTLGIQRHVKMQKPVNGWNNYFVLVDYAIQKGGNKFSGTVDAQVMWRKDPRPGYSAFVVTLMDKEEAEMRKQGIEGGSIGFGMIDSREQITGSFNATWKLNKFSELLPEFKIYPQDLSCQVQ